MKYSRSFLQAALDCIGDQFQNCDAYDYVGMFICGGEL